ncbi:MAG TPA: dicarboxylate/amino acid:cation symporter, partial [Gemmatimonadales bacterium]|nr:dicarboxylate/amino acid:cation symporter [Gemmatimonadales bacterium]
MGIGLILGLLVGLAAWLLARYGHPGLVDLLAGLRPLGTLFINLLSMVVIPLVAAALFAGIAKLGDLRTVGRLVVRSLGFFWATALVAIVIGFLVALALLPRSFMSPEQQTALRAAAGADVSVIQRTAETIPTGLQFLVQLVPANPFKAAADGNLLPVIVFVTIFGIAAAALPVEKRAPLTTIADSVTETLIRIIHWVLWFAPVGIFALVAPLVAQFGGPLLVAMGRFIVAVIIGVFVFIAAVYLPSVAVIARLAPLRFLRAAYPSMLMGFSATSSMAALPTMLDAADTQLQIPRPVSGFVLPLAATINRGGSAVFQAIAVVFIARLYGIPFGFGEMLAAGAAVFLSSLTVASVPSASVISLVPTFQSTGLPLAGLSILLGLDRIPDMFRTMTNVTGHLTSAV